MGCHHAQCENLLVYNYRGGRISCNSRGGPFNRDKGRLLNGWQKGAHGYIREVKEDNIIRLGCENVKIEYLSPNQIKDVQTHLPPSKASNGRGLHSGTWYELQDVSKRHPPGGPIPRNVQQQGICRSQHT
jgi:hypothetical protein